eukprot:212814_1
MQTLDLLFWFNVLFISIQSNKIDFIPPSIVNSTGEYYIATGSSEFQNQFIQCNSSINNNCYVICAAELACRNTSIKCSSNKCDISCSARLSCDVSILHIEYANVSSITCTDSRACQSIKASINAKEAVVRCMYVLSCNFATYLFKSVSTDYSNKSSVSISCNDTGACAFLKANMSNNILLNMQCTNTTGYDDQYPFFLTVSPFANHTFIDCPHYVDIYVPLPYEYNFIFGNIYVNNSLYCIDDKYGITNCSDDSPFPILDIASPSIVNKSGIYYLGIEPLFYRFKQINFNESDTIYHNYYLYCIGSNSCSQSLVIYNANSHSNCYVECTGDYACYQNTIHSIFGSNLSSNSINYKTNSSISIICNSQISQCQNNQWYIKYANSLYIECDMFLGNYIFIGAEQSILLLGASPLSPFIQTTIIGSSYYFSNTYLSINCFLNYSCEGLYISTVNINKFILNCTKYASCFQLTLFVSPLSYHTNIIACSSAFENPFYPSIYVPQSYQSNFLNLTYNGIYNIFIPGIVS